MTSDSSTSATKVAGATVSPFNRLAAAVNGEASGGDAFALAASLTETANADLMMMTVMPDLSLIAPWAGSDVMQDDVEQQMRHMRDEWHPGARIEIDRDRAVARGLMRMVERHHREVLVVGSSHRADEGRVLISGHVRQLIGHLPCPLLLAPRGLATHPFSIRRVAVGVDGGAASIAALASAARFATTADAELVVCGVVDDILLGVGWSSLLAGARAGWSELATDEVTRLEASLHTLTAPLQPPVTIEIRRGAPAAVLTKLSGEVDLLVLGSRRWGSVARLVLGGTGEALVRESRCAVAIVPRPRNADGEHSTDG
jgi:nucleotide-binding universal stress UspA family protein